MNMNISKGIRFYTEHDVEDAKKIADRIIMLHSSNEKFDHWEIYASYILMTAILTNGYRKISEKQLPAVYINDMKKLAESSPEDIKQELMTGAMLHLPTDTFRNMKDVIQNIAKTGTEEFKSITETFGEALNNM